MKRVFDILVSFGALLMLSPAFVVIALAIRLTSPGPILFRQKRVGLRGNPFDIYKFRSMIVSAQKVGPPTTRIGDDRITPIGRILRRFALDELPQFINILKGDMSIVGPRPELPTQIDKYTSSEWAQRHRLRPGLTGLAQVHNRHFITPEHRKELDLSYVKSCDLLTDLRILVLTIREITLRGNF